MPIPPRRFLRPWTMIEHDDAFEVVDAAGVNLAFVEFEDDLVRRAQNKKLSKDEARRLATQVVRLPELVRIAKGIEPSEA